MPRPLLSSPTRSHSRPARRHSRRRIVTVVSILIGIPILLGAGFGVALLAHAGRLPGQAEATRIPVTPFPNLDGTPAAGRLSPPGVRLAFLQDYGNDGDYQYGPAPTTETTPS